jgi:hypothetical protein
MNTYIYFGERFKLDLLNIYRRDKFNRTEEKKTGIRANFGVFRIFLMLWILHMLFYLSEQISTICTTVIRKEAFI